MECWNGWTELLVACVTGNTKRVLLWFSDLDKEEALTQFQMRIALYVAAHFGHLDLSIGLMKKLRVRRSSSSPQSINK